MRGNSRNEFEEDKSELLDALEPFDFHFLKRILLVDTSSKVENI